MCTHRPLPLNASSKHSYLLQDQTVVDRDAAVRGLGNQTITKTTYGVTTGATRSTTIIEERRWTDLIPRHKKHYQNSK